MKRTLSLSIVVALLFTLAFPMPMAQAVAVDDSTCPHCKEIAEWKLWDGSEITQNADMSRGNGMGILPSATRPEWRWNAL